MTLGMTLKLNWASETDWKGLLLPDRAEDLRRGAGMRPSHIEATSKPLVQGPGSPCWLMAEGL